LLFFLSHDGGAFQLPSYEVILLAIFSTRVCSSYLRIIKWRKKDISSNIVGYLATSLAQRKIRAKELKEY